MLNYLKPQTQHNKMNKVMNELIMKQLLYLHPWLQQQQQKHKNNKFCIGRNLTNFQPEQSLHIRYVSGLHNFTLRV